MTKTTLSFRLNTSASIPAVGELKSTLKSSDSSLTVDRAALAVGLGTWKAAPGEVADVRRILPPLPIYPGTGNAE
jgi:hypothetical protein